MFVTTKCKATASATAPTWCVAAGARHNPHIGPPIVWSSWAARRIGLCTPMRSSAVALPFRSTQPDLFNRSPRWAFIPCLGRSRHHGGSRIGRLCSPSPVEGCCQRFYWAACGARPSSWDCTGRRDQSCSFPRCHRDNAGDDKFLVNPPMVSSPYSWRSPGCRPPRPVLGC